MGSLQHIASRKNYTIGRYEQIVLLHWTDIASVEGLEDLRHAFEEATRQNRKVLFFTYLEDRALSKETPDAFRRELAQCLAEWSPRIGGAAIVFEKSGFKGAILRAIVSGVHLMSRKTYPAAVHDSIEKAADWMTKLEAGGDYDHLELGRMLRSSRETVFGRLQVA